MLTSPSPSPSIVLVVALSSTLVLAGCIGQGGQIEAKQVELSYNGSESGSHEAAGACDSEGTLRGSGIVSDGNVHIVIRDGSGNVRFDQTYNANFNMTSSDLSGASGTWKISGDRVGNDILGDQFKGSYAITLRC